MKQTKITRHLRVKLTDTEVLTASRQFADLFAQAEQVLTDKKRVSKDFDARLSALKSAAAVEHSKVLTGADYRDIDCVVEFDIPSRGTKRITRTDTLEVVEECRMTASELQEELPLSEQHPQVSPEAAAAAPQDGSGEPVAPDAPSDAGPASEATGDGSGGNPWQWLDGACLKPARVKLEPSKGIAFEIMLAVGADGLWRSGLEVFGVESDPGWAISKWILSESDKGYEMAGDAVAIAFGLAQAYFGQRTDKPAKATVKWSDKVYGDLLATVDRSVILPGMTLTLGS